MTLRLEIPYATPSLNELVGRGQGQYTFKRALCRWLFRLNDAYLQQRAAAGRPVAGQLWPRPPGQRVQVTIERVSPGPLLDHDNFTGGLKPILDALKAMQLVDDDNDAALELTAWQRTCSPEEGPARWTYITLSTAP